MRLSWSNKKENYLLKIRNTEQDGGRKIVNNNKD